MNTPNLVVEVIANTSALPRGGRFLAVQSHVEADALRELAAIASKTGVKLGKVVYQWAGVYFYAVVIGEPE